MLYAVEHKHGSKITARPGLPGQCPQCRESVRPKCGAIVTWHWAHFPGSTCVLSEPETAWHLWWKSQFPADCVEVRIGNRRADVQLHGTVIEFQHSSISAAEITARENDYGHMLWVFDAAEAYDEDRLIIRNRQGYATFRWKHGRKSLQFCRRPVYLDLGY